MGSAQGIKRKEEGKAQSKAPEDQNVFLAGGHAIDAKTVIEVFFKTACFATGTNVPKCGYFAAANGTTKTERVKIAERCAGINPNFFDTFFRVIDVAATAAFESVGRWIGFSRCFNRRFGRLSDRFALFDGLKFVAHRSTAGQQDSICDNSSRRMPDCFYV